MKKFSANLFGVHATVSISRESPESSRIRQDHEFRKHSIYFTGDYSNWSEAVADATGYNSPLILEKALSSMRKVRDGEACFERDTVVFDHQEVSHSLLCWLLYCASSSSGSLRVMDFGGALGSSYFQNRIFLQQLVELRWGIVEQPNFVAAGLNEFQTDTLQYFYTPEACLKVLEPNFLLFSAALQYIERPWVLLDSLLALGLPYVLIDRTMAHRFGRDRLAVQHVPAWIYDASYPVWLLDADELEKCIKAHGYEIVDSFDPYPGSMFGPDGFQAPYMSWFLRRQV